MNHLVPEQMFSTETEKAQGISAVKALAIASQQGQKIWTITNDNLNLALSRINLGADSENDIRNAINAGKIATAHETRINFNGWVGEGYTLIDPNTGAGAYMISGGGNGADLFALGAALGALIQIIVTGLTDYGPYARLLALGGVSLSVLLGAIALVTLIILSVAITMIAMSDDKDKALTSFRNGILFSLGVAQGHEGITKWGKLNGKGRFAVVIGVLSLIFALQDEYF
ncbi:hypothetical protein D0C16_12940 [Cellvibrio sp. KY-GH-1]|uniref:hypothetical protein n=1 Tax=Cellvibrio sp. KY-GH-1 TaxID=2303332 RepID=UPI001246B5B9|nr:hypothetical protein [Cellvibrio sp. KY-GH-1]QEY16796.1 hypothetical protein D0C16_12940 [Cellvibrio sp. KY-GH-1]